MGKKLDCPFKLKKLPWKLTLEERAMGIKFHHYVCEKGHKTLSTNRNAKKCYGGV
jgi:hypothetical protein